MTNLNLSADQAHLLRDILEQVLSDMSVEIAGTDRKTYRDEIKTERSALRDILAQLAERD